ncbi:ctr family copper transporter [Haematococcus lacustris]|nr:hypothetical protein QJQ45_019299 [Haematococcus lacustris]
MEHVHTGHAGEEGPSSMPMAFTSSIHTTLWLSPWTTTNVYSYGASLLALVALAVLHECLACYRSHCIARFSGSSRGGSSADDPLSVHRHGPSPAGAKLWLSGLYCASMTTSYLLMLAVMTFNVGFFLAVVLGLGLGYYLLFERMDPEHQSRSDGCHARLLAAT